MIERHYVKADGAELFTVVCLPEKVGKFPTIIMRNPYVDGAEDMPEEKVADGIAVNNKNYTDGGYAVVYQHCRGRGKSTGDFVPYIYEREDGLALLSWVRNQPFYNGEIYLCGGSYTSSVHYSVAPFAEDIKGAVLNVQDCEKYNCNYRNGFYKTGHGVWYLAMYKPKKIRKKSYAAESFFTLPLSGFSASALGEYAEGLEDIILHPNKDDGFWNTRYGGGDTHDAVKHANIPILLTTGFYDIYTGGVFDMWNGLDRKTRAKCALIVHPYDHGCIAEGQPIQFNNATLADKFGDYAVKWFNFVRGKGASPVETGKVTYYKLFGDEWRTDDFDTPKAQKTFALGEGERSYVYNPFAPAAFKGGLSVTGGGNVWQDEPNSRYDIISLFTPEFSEDTFIKGKMRVKLTVRSDCEDTCFYVRISLVKEGGYYGLRDDINQISNFDKDYKPNGEIEMDFSFDEHAFVVKKGEKLRIDVSSSAFPSYVRHTNNRGLYSKQETAKIATNTVVLDQSYLTVYYETKA